MGDMIPVGQLAVAANPKQIMKHAKEVADLLMAFVRDRKLAKKFGAEGEHIFLPAWQFAGHFYGYTAKVTRTEPYTDDITGAAGFKAWADAVRVDGSVASSAEAICLNDEANWSERPKYQEQFVAGVGKVSVESGKVRVPSFQLMSMAQTRAMSRALSNVLRFVVVLAGYNDTPAEEMETGKSTERKSDQQTAKQTQTTPTQQTRGGNGGNNPDAVITENQAKRLFAIRKDVNCPHEKLGKIILAYGFNLATTITRGKYDTIVEAVQNWQTFQPPQQ